MPLLGLFNSIYTRCCIHVLFFPHPAFAYYLSTFCSTTLTPSSPTASPAPLVASVSLKYHPLPWVMSSSWKLSLGNLRLWLLHQYLPCCWWLWHVSFRHQSRSQGDFVHAEAPFPAVPWGYEYLPASKSLLKLLLTGWQREGSHFNVSTDMTFDFLGITVHWNCRWAACTMLLTHGLISIKLNEPLVTAVVHTCTLFFSSISQSCMDVKFTGISGRTPSSSMCPNQWWSQEEFTGSLMSRSILQWITNMILWGLLTGWVIVQKKF